MGYYPRELIDKRICKFIHPDDLHHVSDSLKEAFNGNGSISMEYRCKHKNGNYIYLHSRGNMLEPDKKRFILVNRNITEKKETEQKLKEIEQKLKDSEVKYSHLFNSFPYAIWLVNLKGVIVDCNSTMNKFMSIFKTEDLIGKHFREVFKLFLSKGDKRFENFDTIFKERFKRLLKNNYLEPIEFQINRGDGKKLWISLESSFLYINNESLIQVLIKDITESKEAELLIRESEERFKLIATSAHDAILQVNEYGVIVFWNKAAEIIFGYSSEEALGEYMYELIYDSHYRKFYEKAYDIARKLKKTPLDGKSFENIGKRKDGTKFLMEISLSTTITKNRLNSIAIIRDISKKKEAEQQLKDSEIKFKSIATSAKDAIIQTTNAGMIIFWNKAAERIFGYSANEALGKFSYDLLYKERDSKFIKKGYEISRRTNMPPPYNEFTDLTGKRKDGKEFPMEISFSSFKIKNKLNLISIIRDLTERKEKENQLKESENKYRLITENIYDLIAVLNNRYEFDYINEYVHKKILGYSNEDLIGKSALNLIHPEDIESAIKGWRTVKTGRETTELRFKRKDGEYIWLEIRGTQFKGSDGEKELLLVSRDINERKKTEQKLKESEERLRNFFEASPISIEIFDSEGSLIQANKACLGIFGVVDYNEIIGFKLFEDPNVTNKAKKNLKNGKSIRYISIFDFEKVKEFNLYQTTKSGGIITDTLITPLFQNEQNIIGYMVQIQDITEREMYQERLKKSEMKFRHLFEGTPYAIVLFNLDGFVIDCNSNTESLFNLPKHKVIGKNYQSIPIFKSETFLMLKMGLRVVKEGITEESKEKVFESDGKQIWINCLLSLVKLGEEYFIQAILRDITSKKNYEHIVYEQNKKLSDISNLKSELMRRASHELKTPLISIKGFSDLLLNLHYHKFDDDTITIIEEIKDGCLRLENLIGIILKSSKLESGKIKLDAKQDDLSFLIKYCVQELGMLFKMRDQKVKLKISNNLITKFEKERIYEVLSNLLTNAIKYSPPFSEIEIKSKSKKDFIITSVKDKGIGFTEEEKKMIFKQFGKIERYGQGWDIGTGGSGLGLYIASKIVELHGGRIWVESEGKNMGSTFYFTLPIIKD